jgi:hypothetical protein
MSILRMAGTFAPASRREEQGDHYLLIAQILFREAESLINGKAK